MEGEESEQLFLLEFLVDSVRIKRSAGYSSTHINSIPSQLTTIFQFLKFPPLEIREKDQPNKGDEVPSFRVGKSCLFAIPSKRLVDLSKLFNLSVSVARRFPPGVLPEKTVLGETTVDISSDFAYVVTEVLTDPHAIPKSKAIRNSYVLSVGDNVHVGTIVLYIRISCFGKLIVNEFQLNNENSVVFHSEQVKREMERVADEPEYTTLDIGTDEEAVDCRRINLRGSSSESSAPSGVFAEDDYTEVAAKVQGRWITIRVPKDKLLTHAGDICHLDSEGRLIGGSDGARAPEFATLPVVRPPLAKGVHYDLNNRVIHVQGLGGGEAASLPTSRESTITGGNGTPLHMRPTSTPMDIHPRLALPASPSTTKASKGKGKNVKGKASKGDRKSDKKSKKRCIT